MNDVLQRRIKTTGLYAFLILYAIVVIYPMFWLLCTSLKDSWAIFRNPWALPETLRWVNYRNAFQGGEAGKGFLGSVFVDLLSLGLVPVLAIVAAVAAARFRLLKDRTLFYVFVAGIGVAVLLTGVPLIELTTQFLMGKLKGNFGLGGKFLNSVIVDVISLILILLISAMAAYALARFRFPGNRGLFYLFLGGMALPVFLAVIPLFQLLQHLDELNKRYGLAENLQLLDSRLGLVIVYTAYSLSFTIFVLHGFFRTLPGELAEAAAIDGCSPFGTFWKIMFPLAKPGLVTAGIFVFIGLWNEFPLALVLIKSSDNETLPLAIANLTMTQKYQADWGALFAALAIGVIPTVVLYSIFQKQIQAGLTAGAVKG